MKSYEACSLGAYRLICVYSELRSVLFTLVCFFTMVCIFPLGRFLPLCFELVLNFWPRSANSPNYHNRLCHLMYGHNLITEASDH